MNTCMCVYSLCMLCICMQVFRLNMMRSLWTSAIIKVLLFVVLPTHVWAYKILMIPLFGKSHVFSNIAIAEGLVNRGHKVTLFIGENFPANLLQLKNRSQIVVFRYRDMNHDYDAMDEECSKAAMESGLNTMIVMASIMKEVCVNFSDC